MTWCCQGAITYQRPKFKANLVKQIIEVMSWTNNYIPCEPVDVIIYLWHIIIQFILVKGDSGESITWEGFGKQLPVFSALTFL